MKAKLRQLEYKGCLSQIKGIDKKGIVEFYASIFGNVDRANEIVDRGAYLKSISENKSEIQHYKNHNPNMMPGVVMEITEDEMGLMVKSKLILTTKDGSETYEQYKAMAEAGKSMGHSVGYAVIKDGMDMMNVRHLKEMYLAEVSTLTMRAANPEALTVGIKSFDEMEMDELVLEESFYKALLNCKFTDAKLEHLEMIKNHISALIEASRPQALVKSEPLTKEEILTILRQ